LGVAVLQLVLTQVLYEKFPTSGEGPLTKARAHLVNRNTLANQGRRLGLGEHLVLSRGEELNKGRQRSSTLADAFEALLGAIFLDGGFKAAEDFIQRQFQSVFVDLQVIPNLHNPKGELQEVLQAESPEPPHYQLETVSGPDHDRLFVCAVYYRGEELGRGQGKSKKEAESVAALNALTLLRERASQKQAAEAVASDPSNSDAPQTNLEASATSTETSDSDLLPRS